MAIIKYTYVSSNNSFVGCPEADPWGKLNKKTNTYTEFSAFRLSRAKSKKCKKAAKIGASVIQPPTPPQSSMATDCCALPLRRDPEPEPEPDPGFRASQAEKKGRRKPLCLCLRRRPRRSRASLRRPPPAPDVLGVLGDEQAKLSRVPSTCALRTTPTSLAPRCGQSAATAVAATKDAR